jgi:hypothetical protein
VTVNLSVKALLRGAKIVEDSKPSNGYTRTYLVPATVELAKALLASSKANRAINAAQVQFLRRQMREGKWDERVAALVIHTDDFDLLSGHHRCHALIEEKSANPKLDIQFRLRETDNRDEAFLANLGRAASGADMLTQAPGSPFSHREAAAAQQVVQLIVSRIYKPKHKVDVESVRTIAGLIAPEIKAADAFVAASVAGRAHYLALHVFGSLIGKPISTTDYLTGLLVEGCARPQSPAAFVINVMAGLLRPSWYKKLNSNSSLGLRLASGAKAAMGYETMKSLAVPTGSSVHEYGAALWRDLLMNSDGGKALFELIDTESERCSVADLLEGKKPTAKKFRTTSRSNKALRSRAAA